MRSHVLEREQTLALDPERAFEFFADARNLERITPPWLRFRVVTPGEIVMRAGTLIEYRLVLHRIPVRWLTRIETWEPPTRFVDRQLRGPYALWEHSHSFEPVAGGTLVRDRIRYRIGFGILGGLAQLLVVRRDLDRIFDYRREQVSNLAA